MFEGIPKPIGMPPIFLTRKNWTTSGVTTTDVCLCLESYLPSFVNFGFGARVFIALGFIAGFHSIFPFKECFKLQSGYLKLPNNNN